MTMKVREVREVLRRLAAIHDRFGSQDCAAALRKLDDIIDEFDAETISAFVKRAARN